MIDSISNAYAAAQIPTRTIHRASLGKPVPVSQRLMIAAQLMDSVCHGSDYVRSILTSANILCGMQMEYCLTSAQEACAKKDQNGDDFSMTLLRLAELNKHANDIREILSKNVFQDKPDAVNARSICALIKDFISTAAESDKNNGRDGAVARNFTAYNPFLMLGVASEMLASIDRQYRRDTFKPLTESADFSPLNDVALFLEKTRLFLSTNTGTDVPTPQGLSVACSSLERLHRTVNDFLPDFVWNNAKKHLDIISAVTVLKNFTEPYNQPIGLVPKQGKAGAVVIFADELAKRGKLQAGSRDVVPAGN